jgi:plastocyanin
MRSAIKALCVTLLMALAISAITFQAYAAESIINQKNSKFIPDAITINVGDTVRFTNSDRFNHDVTIMDPDGVSSDKGLMNYQEEFAVSFAKTGIYKVRDRLHPAMTAIITVQ